MHESEWKEKMSITNKIFQPTTEGKCDNDYQLEWDSSPSPLLSLSFFPFRMSGGDSSFESVEGELVCDNEQLNGGRKGGFKLLDIDAIRCAKESKDEEESNR